MNRKALADLGTDTAVIAAAFMVRNAVVLIGLLSFLLIALAR